MGYLVNQDISLLSDDCRVTFKPIRKNSHSGTLVTTKQKLLAYFKNIHCQDLIVTSVEKLEFQSNPLVVNVISRQTRI